MNRISLLFILALAACAPYHDPCLKPCPTGTPPHLCECRPHQGGGSFAVPAAAPAVEITKPEDPKKPVDKTGWEKKEGRHHG